MLEPGLAQNLIYPRPGFVNGYSFPASGCVTLRVLNCAFYSSSSLARLKTAFNSWRRQ